MKTLNVSISEKEYKKFGIKNDHLAFSELIELVSQKLMRESLGKSVELAAKYGLSDMTMDDINKEVKAVRKNAKGNN